MYRKKAANVYDSDDFTKGYLEAAFWTSTDDEGNYLESGYNWSDLSPQSVNIIKGECDRFQDENRGDLHKYIDANFYPPNNEGHAGHNFWLDRNRHGAGFSDDVNMVPGGNKELNAVCERLKKAAQNFGEQNLVVGDDGKIYVV